MLQSTQDIQVLSARTSHSALMADRFRQDLLPYIFVAWADAYMETDAMQSVVRVYIRYFSQGINAHIADMCLLPGHGG